jgi:hypothetical protein
MNSSEQPNKRQLLCDEIKQHEVNSGLGENNLRCLNLKSTVSSLYRRTNQNVSKGGNTAFALSVWGIPAVCIKDIVIVVELSNLAHNEEL